MRRFEYVGGASEKFWEIDRDGTSVTVRFGRIGSKGQTRVKELRSVLAAETEMARLITEKTRKGYVEGVYLRITPSKTVPPPSEAHPESAGLVATTGVAAQAAATASDEDKWSVPDGWWSHTHPFRGLSPALAEPDPAAASRVAELRELEENALSRALDHPSSEGELVQRARRYLAIAPGVPGSAREEPDPLGAAAVASVLVRLDERGDGREKALIDAWVLNQGIAFAAEAATLLPTVCVTNVAPSTWPRPAPELVIGRAPDGDVVSLLDAKMLTSMRALLAGASDAEYEAAVERISTHRDTTKRVRIATSFLVPTRQDWLEADIASVNAPQPVDNAGMMLASATTAQQLTEILGLSSWWRLGKQPPLLYSLAAHVGPALAPFLARWLDNERSADAKRLILAILLEMPTDEALGILVERVDQRYVQPVFLEAIERYPFRAMRLLAEASTGTGGKAVTARELLRAHSISNPQIAEAVRPGLASKVARALDAVASARPTVPVATGEKVPSILVEVPWATKRTRPAPTVVEVTHWTPLTLHWKGGEQRAWADARDGYAPIRSSVDDWPELVAAAVERNTARTLPILAAAPDDLVRPHLATFVPHRAWDPEPLLRRMLARFGDDAVGFVLRAVLLEPGRLGGLLAPYEGTEVASLMAAWYAGTKSLRLKAISWFDRHPAAAARDLIPVAVGKRGKDRSNAEAALHGLAQQGHESEVRAAARVYGPAALDAVNDLLTFDPLLLLPARIPPLPAWLDPAHLPPVLIADRSAVLPVTALGHLCQMLAISKPGATYAGVDVVKRAVDAGSLSEMAWSLLDRWRVAGYPSKDGWVLDALGVVGDDETVRRLAPLIRAWPGEGAHKRAVAGLDVLSSIGTDVALMHLHGIAEKARFRGVRTEARERMQVVADDLGLTPEQLADRLVPDFGLEPDGSLLLDYGARRFRVGFDEQLKPIVSNEDGSLRKFLPKPAADDDQALAAAAHSLFAGLKKDVKTVAADQIRRFERAMVAGRRWTAADQRKLFIDHPLLWQVARRLVWATFGRDDQMAGAFRVAEDRTLADVSDDDVNVVDDQIVGVAHPLHLGEDLPKWVERFTDYEILQPFPQLGREVFRLGPEDRSSRHLSRFAGTNVFTGKVLALAHRGWDRGTPDDSGISHAACRRGRGGQVAVVNLSPGIRAGGTMESPEQEITGVWLNDAPPEWARAEGNLEFGVLDPIDASELLRDLEFLVGH